MIFFADCLEGGDLATVSEDLFLLLSLRFFVGTKKIKEKKKKKTRADG